MNNKLALVDKSAQTLASGKPDLRVAFILLNQFTLTPVSGLVESLRFAADISFRSQQIFCQWDWMTLNNQAVTASCGMSIQPTCPLVRQNLLSYDYIALAGGLLEETRNPSDTLLELLRYIRAQDRPIISLCSASFVLAKAGLLDGRKAAIHFTIRDEFIQRFPKVTAIEEENFVDDNSIITCPGGLAIDLATYIIRKHCGDIRAQKVLKYLLEGGLLEKSSLSIPKIQPHVYQNQIVHKAIAFMQENLSAVPSLKAVAKHAGTSTRQLHRAFLTNTHEAPACYWRKLRLEHARKKLADSSAHVTTIAIECGFSDASHFIAWFRKQYGETPAAYRKRRHEVERISKQQNYQSKP